MSFSTRIAAELRGDRVVWAILVLLGLFSILAVYSSTGTLAYRERGGNTEAYLFKHGIILAAGFVVTYFAHLLHYRRYMNWSPVLLPMAIILLLYTMMLGPVINEARRWIVLPVIGLSFQTSDFAKLALIIYVARAISSKQDYIEDFRSAFLPIIVPVVVVCGLIAPADLSTSIILFLACLLMMFVGRVALKYIGLLMVTGGVVFVLLIMLGRTFPEHIRVATWESRLQQFYSPEPGGEDTYQIDQAKIALGNGGLTGVGPGNSTQRNYLPYAHADFIYAVICEEYGVLGGATIIGLYLLLFFRVTRLITKSPKAFGAMVAMGLSLVIVVQAFFHIGINVNLLPVTGLTLPLISMGGTSLLFTCIAFGIILSVSKYIESVAE
ncbi:FtsW/RodA/SpoVE family cell cycle protein [Lewinella cohaerens]|jgi:cell division protein FtsW|uniref:FtsW/RodA/SpoVE family cell cycle protein n=1 Tax=Lewinella cohaerens TaxID=70995 RepID=UPI00036AE24C|nr:FtsW/RodA/SpoVE family cell cycle protein [Lewinella cohaerens]